MSNLQTRYSHEIAGVLSCYDRILLFGTLPTICYRDGMAAYLHSRQRPLTEYLPLVMGLRDRIKQTAEALAAANGQTIEFIRKASVRKEEVAQARRAARGDTPGLVCILSAEERCESYEVRHRRPSGAPYLTVRGGKCLHYYFYFLDAELGLLHLRVPTWCPYRLQVCFNGHAWLAHRLAAAGVAFTLQDNAFHQVADYAAAQRLADDWAIARLHARLDEYARRCCPVMETFETTYHWSVSQVEYATDIVFRDPTALRQVYEHLSRAVILAAKPERVTAFFGRQFPHLPKGAVDTLFVTRPQGTCVKHTLWPVSIKMYDKHHRILRVETVADDITYFRHHRPVVQRTGHTVCKEAPFRKHIYSLPELMPVMRAANARYLDFLAQLEDPTDGARRLDDLSHAHTHQGRRYRGLNFFAAHDQRLLRTIGRAEFMVNGLRNRHVRRLLGGTTSQVSRLLKNLRLRGLIRKATRCYKYYLTALGRKVIAAGVTLQEFLLIPALSDRCAPSPDILPNFGRISEVTE